MVVDLTFLGDLLSPSSGSLIVDVTDGVQGLLLGASAELCLCIATASVLHDSEAALVEALGEAGERTS
jgi:hypothetical protein